jgi:outer membrane receptor for ferrienterochelin and colicins
MAVCTSNVFNSHRDGIGKTFSFQYFLCANRPIYLKGIFILLLFLFASYCIAQNQVVYLNDKITNEPIAFARVKLVSENKKTEYHFSLDSLGKLTLPKNELYQVSITAIGYKAYSGKISPEDKIIFLEPDNINLENVVVTGEMKPVLADKSIYTVNVLNKHEIDLKAANNLGDALKGELGIQYRSEGVFGDFMRIQGLSGEHVKILIDGIPIAGRIGGVIDLNQLNLYSIDHIEIIKGPMSVIYGSDAMAGVINIITKKTVNKNIVAEIQAYYETVGIYNFNAYASKTLGKHSLEGHFARNFNSGWSPDANSRYKYFKPKMLYSGGLSYNYQSSNILFKLRSDLLYEELHDPDSVHLSVKRTDNSDSTYGVYLATDYYHYTTRSNSSMDFNYMFNPRSSFTVQTGYSFYKKTKITYYKNLVDLSQEQASDPMLSDTTRYNLFLVRGTFNYEPDAKIKLQTGINYSPEQINSQRTQGIQRITDIAAFASLIYAPSGFISLQPGVRIIHNSNFEAPLIYSFNLLLNPANFQIRLSYGKSFRAPSLKELYMEFVDNNHHVFGNPELQAETGSSLGLSCNYKLAFAGLTFMPEGTLFYNSIENAIQLAIDPSRPGWGYYFNIAESKYKTEGYTLALHANLKNGFSTSAGISTTGKSTLNETNNFVFSTDYTLQTNYLNSKYGMEASLQYKYSGPYYDYVGTFDESFVLQGIQEQQFASYNLMDLVLIKHFAKSGISISAGIKNIFDVTTIDSKGTLDIHGGGSNFVLAGYGRTYFLKLIWKIGG